MTVYDSIKGSEILQPRNEGNSHLSHIASSLESRLAGNYYTVDAS
jgi:hypothetical protein